ncbi:MAG: SdpI family protein [Marinicella sp.]
MKSKKILYAVISIIIVTWIVAFWYEPSLPDRMPSHWNAQGEVDGYMDKPMGVFILPIISTVTCLILYLLPGIAPKGFKIDAAKKVYEIIIFVMSVFLLGIMILTFEASLNKEVNINQWVTVAIGALFLTIGNYLTKVPKNFFLGIRTPWTLASDEVWYKTHRLGSWTFVISGALVMLGGFMHWPINWVIYILLAAALIPFIYSLIIYKKIEGFD